METGVARPVERWLPVTGWEGYYSVSDEGNLRSHAWGRTRDMKPSPTQFGHRKVTLYRHGRPVTRLVHRLVLEAFAGPIPPGMVTRHLDGDPANNQLKNLSWGTQAENLQDAVRHGTTTRGEVAVLSKLRTEDVLDIRASKGKKFARILAEEYGVSKSLIEKIWQRKTWSWL